MSYPYKTQFFLKHPKYEPPLNDQDAQIDPKNKLEPKCLEKCSKYVKLYDVNSTFIQSCAERVIAHPEQHLQCLGQHYDIRYCVDNCVSNVLSFRLQKIYLDFLNSIFCHFNIDA